MENINLIVNNQHCFNEDVYTVIIQKLNINTADEIFDVINILTENKHIFREKDNLTNYNLIIRRLISTVETLKEEKTVLKEKTVIKPSFYALITEFNNFNELEFCKNRDVVLEKLPLLKNCFYPEFMGDKNSIQLTPIVPNEYNKIETVAVIKFLLKIIDSTIKKNKIFISLTIFDYIFRNYNIVKEHQKFAKTVYDKIEEFLSDPNTKTSIKNELTPKGYDENVFEIWKEVLKNELTKDTEQFINK